MFKKTLILVLAYATAVYCAAILERNASPALATIDPCNRRPYCF